MQIGKGEVGLLAFGISGFHLRDRGGKLRRIRRRMHVFVTHQGGQFAEGIWLAVFVGLRLLARRCGQSIRDLLHSVMVGVDLGRHDRQSVR